MPRLTVFAPLLTALSASVAHAEPPLRDLGVTVAPVGAYVLKDTDGTRESGYSAGVAWGYRRELSVVEVGGHMASSRLRTEATPMSIRITPAGPRRIRPYLGAGASLLLAHEKQDAAASRTLQVGAELCGGVGVELGRQLFLSAEARYQNFSADGDPFSGERQSMTSGYLGLGFRL
ncbi:porin family protein [Myxococcus sp. RHSTA-1-4]|uniref:porin family protein n=1 Tax=Myxococcus sp. RHSTA-1-4 TaxID=2874601 RepID=UPI001CBD6B46|nr:porin family protein [Myxococcus sp. RHSTA-1-4]MBZ4414865.1 porin family protein [Myxococcus sp. RHSTA-1-4]